MTDEIDDKRALRNHRKEVVRDTTTLTSDMQKDAHKKKPESVKERGFNIGQTLMKWKTPEFVYYEKSRNWYIVVVLIIAALIAYAIYERSFLMAVTFIIAGGIFYFFAQKKPAQLDIAITDDGIKYHDRFFPYEDLEGFWITYEPPNIKTLTVSTRYLMIPKVSIILTDQDPVELRKVMIDELPEDKDLREGAIDNFARRINF